RLEFVELVLNLLARALACALHQQSTGERPGVGSVQQVFFVAEAQRQSGDDIASACLLGQERELQSGGRRPGGSRVNVGGRRIDLFGGRRILREVVNC